MDDLNAVHRMKNGDFGGLETLVLKYQVKAIRTAFLITHDTALAEDVVQDTFVRLYRNIQRFNSDRPFGPYLMRSVVNAALNALRREKKTTSLDADPGLVERLLEYATTVEAQVEKTQLRGKVLHALDRLSPRQRAVIVQRYYLEFSEREMAEALESPPGTVKWLLYAARGRLRDLLGDERNVR